MNKETTLVHRRKTFFIISILSKIRSLLYILFIIITFDNTLKSADAYNFSGNNGKYEMQNNENDMPKMFNRMVCENEKLILACNKENHVIKIEKAYYGRYSITPCNKNHLKYTKGCTANNSLAIIRRL